MKCLYCGFTAETSDDFESHDCPNQKDETLNGFLDSLMDECRYWFEEWRFSFNA